MKSNLFKKLLPIFAILVLSFWSVKPLFNTGFFPMHDDTQVARVFEMHKALADGAIPARWVADLGYGYGYPIFNFYAPLAYYIGAFFMGLGFNALISTKIMIGLGILLSGIFMYLLAREFWGRLGGIISALLYVYAPYHALNVYVRGAIAEMWAYAFIPLIFFSIYKSFVGSEELSLLDKKSKKRTRLERDIWGYVCLAAISYAGLIVSHNLTAMMVTPFLFIFSFYLYGKLRFSEHIYKPYMVLIGLLFGIIISSFYWLPVIFEMKYTNVLSVVGGGSDFRDHFACLGQLWNSPWGFAGSGPGCIDGQSLKIGKIHILLSLMSLLVLPIFYKKEKNKLFFLLFSLGSLLISIFLTLESSKLIWNAIPHMAFFQFPWRFLMLVSFFISFLGGAVLFILMQKYHKNNFSKYIYWLAFVFLSVAIISFNSKIFVPQSVLDRTAVDYTSDKELKYRVSRISDEYMPKDFLKPIFVNGYTTRRVGSSDSVVVTGIIDKTYNLSFDTKAQKKSKLEIGIAYFPAWHVYINGKQQWFGYSNKGLIVDVPKGISYVEIRFEQTAIEKFGNTLSVTGVIVLIIGIIVLSKNETNHKKTS